MINLCLGNFQEKNLDHEPDKLLGNNFSITKPQTRPRRTVDAASRRRGQPHRIRRAVDALLPASPGSGLEIGGGSGRFASCLRVPTGVEPSIPMAEREDAIRDGNGEGSFTVARAERPS